MPPRTIAIGDIHGCHLALAALLTEISPQPEDTIITLGDYIDRGPDSQNVVDQLLDLSGVTRLVTLLGNHEIMLLDVLAGSDDGEAWKQYGGKETLASYGGDLDKIPKSHRFFFENLRHTHETSTHFFVHANYHPDLPLESQPEELLFWHHLRPPITRPHFSGKTAVVGHTPQKTGKVLRFPHVVGIDTFCFGSGWLTAYDVNTKQVWQANRLGEINTSPEVNDQDADDLDGPAEPV